MNPFLYELAIRVCSLSAEGYLPLRAIDLYHRYQTIRSTFTSNTLSNGAAWSITIALLVFFVLLILLSSRSRPGESAPATAAHPLKLFEEILESLDLTGEEKHLLREMAEGARLQHPAMCLLSPGLLDSARAVWRKEKGDASLSPLKRQKIDGICCKLFDHLTPSTIAEQPPARETIPA